MSNTRITTILLLAALLAVTIAAGLVWATTGSGTSSTLLGRGTFEGFRVEREVEPQNEDFEDEREREHRNEWWEVEVAAKPSLDVATQIITFQPGGHSGWHSHPGPVFITVMSGTMTFYSSEDRTCSPIVRTAGQGFLDVGEHAHIARNESGAPATNVVTYFAPVGAALRIDQPKPPNCPF